MLQNVVSRANKTQEALDSLTTQLNETAIFIDNVTNTSLALANTQFIESRVQEDNIEIGQQAETSVEVVGDFYDVRYCNFFKLLLYQNLSIAR